MISSSTPNPVRPIGSAVDLTCTVEFSPAVDIPVAVNVEWIQERGYDIIYINSSQAVMRDTTTYTSTITISSLGRNQSGFYMCDVYLLSATDTAYIISIYYPFFFWPWFSRSFITTGEIK